MKKVLLILGCLLLLVGCSKNSEDISSKEKANTEIEYIGKCLVEMLNELNNIKLSNYELTSEKISKQSNNEESSDNSGEQTQSNSSGEKSQNESSQGGDESEKKIMVTEMERTNILSTDNERIDWETIKSQIELINTSWSIVMYDLKDNNVDNKDIIEFGDLLNKTILSIRDEEKEESLSNLTNLYAYIPQFYSVTSNEKSTQNIERTKYNILSAYSFASLDDWESVETSISEAEDNFLNIVNDKEYSKNKKFKVNKTNILIEDLKASSKDKDKQLFFMKYKNLIESLNSF